MGINPKYLLLLFITICFFSLTGCKKKMHSKLVGTWEMVKFDKYDYPAVLGKVSKVTYTFLDGDMMIREFDYVTTSGTDTAVKDTGYYYIQVKKFKTYIKMVQLDGYDYNGIWWIHKLDATVLAIQRTETLESKGGAYLRNEFLKK